MGVDIREFNRCKNLIGYWIHENKNVIDELLSEKIDIVNSYVKPLRIELSNNLLYFSGKENKIDQVRFYLFELNEVQGFFKLYKELLLTGSLKNYATTKYEHTGLDNNNRKLSEFENYVVNSHIVFGMIILEIQLSCITYNIDFFEICEELKMLTEYFDSSILLFYKEEKEKKETPQIFSDENSYNNFLSLFDSFDRLDKNRLPKTGFQAVAKAIFDEGQLLFKNNVTLKDYIIFLNVEYDVKLKDFTKLSDGTRHKFDVVKALKTLMPNKAE